MLPDQHFMFLFKSFEIYLYIVFRHLDCIINKGAELASATVPWHWLFFCLASKLCYKKFASDFPISLEASKWHWLILASIGALDNK